MRLGQFGKVLGQCLEREHGVVQFLLVRLHHTFEKPRLRIARILGQDFVDLGQGCGVLTVADHADGLGQYGRQPWSYGGHGGPGGRLGRCLLGEGDATERQGSGEEGGADDHARRRSGCTVF